MAGTLHTETQEDLEQNTNDPDEMVTEIFLQDGVMLTNAPAQHMEYLKYLGTLMITKYTKPNEEGGTLYIEWKPTISVTIESDTQDHEWAVVNTVERRTRTLSGTLIPEEINRSKYLRVRLSDIKSYKVSNNHRKLAFNDGCSEIICGFAFQNGNADFFTIELRKYIKTTPARRDKHLYVVIGEISEADRKIEKSFNALSLFPDEPHYMWNLVKNFQQKPYQTTMQAFAKVTDIVFTTPGHREMDDDIKQLLSKSLTAIENSTTTHSQGEYEFVANIVPKLPERKDFPRSRPLTKEQWHNLQDCYGRIEDAETTKLTIFRGGITPKLRSTVWKYLLNFYSWDSTRDDRARIYREKKEEYFRMKHQWSSMLKIQEDNFSDYRERKSLIEKDVNRTDRHLEYFAGDDNVHLTELYDILLTYVMYNFDLGYVQGMSDLLSPILYLVGDEVDAFWCFVGFMDKVGNNFDMDQAGMKEQLHNLHTVLKFVDPELANYLDAHESGNMFFCFRWLLVWFKRELDMEDVMRLWEVLWTGLPCKNFHLLISVAILQNEKTTVIENEFGFTEILKHINELSLTLNVDSIINKAEGIYNQIKEASHADDKVREILGLPKLENTLIDSPNTNSFTYLPDVDLNEQTSINLEDNEVHYEKALSNNFL